MHYTGTVWRPPFEFRSLLLQVTTGCSHNGCSFCSMYRTTPFHVSPMEEVRADLEEAARRFPETERVFLLSGDAFVLPAEKLLKIAEAARKALPKLKTISCYASVQNVKNKTVRDLKALRAAGISEPNFGIETGLPSLLKDMNKGFTVEEAREQLGKLREAGMDFSVNLILGARGAAPDTNPGADMPEGNASADAWIREKAAADAALMNELLPSLIFVTTLHHAPGSPLHEAVRKGQFRKCEKEDILREEILLLEMLELKNCIFLGIHTSDPVPVAGMLPRDRDAMISKLRDAMPALS